MSVFEKVIYSKSPDETMHEGFEFAKHLEAGDIVALDGDLGQGKTVFAKGICSYFHVRDYVVSPSYTLLNIYRGDLTIYHFDIYRLETEDDLFNIGYFEYSSGSGLTLVEWSENLPEIFNAPEVWHVKITCEQDNTRKITIRGTENDNSRD